MTLIRTGGRLLFHPEARRLWHLPARVRAHLNRYLAEFDFRYSYRIKTGFDDLARMDRALAGIVGKRLTYRSVSGAWTA